MNDEELKKKIVEAAKDFEWKPPVAEGTFADYEFTGWPWGVFPRYPLRKILTDSAIDADGE